MVVVTYEKVQIGFWGHCSMNQTKNIMAYNEEEADYKMRASKGYHKRLKNGDSLCWRKIAVKVA